MSRESDQSSQTEPALTFVSTPEAAMIYAVRFLQAEADADTAIHSPDANLTDRIHSVARVIMIMNSKHLLIIQEDYYDILLLYITHAQTLFSRINSENFTLWGRQNPSAKDAIAVIDGELFKIALLTPISEGEVSARAGCKALAEMVLRTLGIPLYLRFPDQCRSGMCLY
ncbi:hypothetical protein LTR17_020957 [Elasticomyces elasticus]|nr:hypothetical protein LTR17_020957 [Elasticomyces elasticus]